MKRGLSQGAFSDLCGIKQAMMSRVELGGSYHPSVLREIAAALGVTEHWLTTGEGPRVAAAAVREAAAERFGGKMNYEKVLKAVIGSARTETLKQLLADLANANQVDEARLMLEELGRRKESKK